MGEEILNNNILEGEMKGVDNVVIDTKRRRMEPNIEKNDDGPVRTQIEAKSSKYIK